MEQPSKQLPIIRPLFVASIFAALAGLIIYSGIDLNPPWTHLLPLGVIISVPVIFVVGLGLHRRQWLITPVAGILSTLFSASYSITSYWFGPCGGTSSFSGYPYPWFQKYTINNPGDCGGEVPLHANPLFFFRGQLFLVDVIFYTVVALAILELYLGTVEFSRKRSGINLGTKAAGLPKDASLPGLSLENG
jgi:hypothetical protein